MLDQNIDTPVTTHCGISHTRWATHGVPSERNSHPQRSDIENSFVVVHNGIVTNYKDVKILLEKRGYEFESETDTEIIAKLIHHLYLLHPNCSFRELVEQAIQQLVSSQTLRKSPTLKLLIWPQEGAFALAFKSKYFPGECVATRRGSPLLVGIKTKTRLATDHIPILYGKGKSMCNFSLWLTLCSKESLPLFLLPCSFLFSFWLCETVGKLIDTPVCAMFFLVVLTSFSS